MITHLSLNTLYEKHKKLQSSILKKRYNTLKNNEELDHFARIVMAIEGIIYHHETKNEIEIRRHVRELKKELDFAKKHQEGNVFAESDYDKELSKWNDWVTIYEVWFQPESIRTFKDEDNYKNKFVKNLTSLYKDFEHQKMGFFEGIETAKKIKDHVHEKQLKKAEDKNISEEKGSISFKK